MKISKEFKVGLFMVTALVLLYFGFNYLKGIDFFSSNNRYYAIYENVDKLAVSNQVYVNGYAVGRVSDIDILQSNGNQVLVELEISSNVVLYDSSVAILTGDFLGNKSIILDIRQGGNKLLKADTLRSELDRGIADILAESALPVADNLQTTLRKFNTLVDGLIRNTQQIDTVFQGLQGTPALLNRTLAITNREAVALSDSIKAVSGNLNAALADLKPTLANFHSLSDSLKAIEIGSTLKKVQTSLTKLNETLGKLNEGNNTASKLLTDDELYLNLNKLLVSLDSLATHFNSNPKHFMAPLGKSKKKIEKDLAKGNSNESGSQ